MARRLANVAMAFVAPVGFARTIRIAVAESKPPPACIPKNSSVSAITTYGHAMTKKVAPILVAFAPT